MNGVLEIRWEDEIKKTPPPPDCVQSGKDPKDYTPEDLSSILEWENEIKFLESERERYRVMLVNEQAKIDQTIDEQYRKFNMKVGTALMEKIQVEFAIASEDLKLLRNEQYHFRRFHLAGIERSLRSIAFIILIVYNILKLIYSAVNYVNFVRKLWSTPQHLMGWKKN